MRTCLVLGSATCLEEDVRAATKLGQFDAVIAAKQAGIWWPGELYGWVSLHPEFMKNYVAERRANGYPDAREVVANAMAPGVDRVIEYKWPEQLNRSGSSGGVAAKYAIEEGFTKVVLCGIPMVQSMGRIDGREYWASAKTYQVPFEASAHRLQGIVKSMSGWARQLLGEPTAEWLKS